MNDLDIREINFAVANTCNGNCIYCPRSFHHHDPKFMSVTLVDMVIEQMTDKRFKAKHQPTHSVVSENGEPLMNPDFLDILREIRATGLITSVYTNFTLLTEEIAEKIIREDLLSTIHVNIDGYSPESYTAVKKLPYYAVEKNLLRFLELRDKMESPIKVIVHVITQATYVGGVRKLFGVMPMKFSGPLYGQDEELIKAKWEKAVDFVGAEDLVFWAERGNERKRPGPYACPKLADLKHKAFINPRGDWYACCLDAENRLVLGNVFEEPIWEIAESEKRKKLIYQVEHGEFDAIGLPCSRVDCCQVVSLNDLRK